MRQLLLPRYMLIVKFERITSISMKRRFVYHYTMWPLAGACIMDFCFFTEKKQGYVGRTPLWKTPKKSYKRWQKKDTVHGYCIRHLGGSDRIERRWNLAGEELLPFTREGEDQTRWSTLNDLCYTRHRTSFCYTKDREAWFNTAPTHLPKTMVEMGLYKKALLCHLAEAIRETEF